VLVEAAWHYRHKPRICQRQHVLQQTLSPKVAAIAWRAQERLHRRYWALAQKGKPAGKIGLLGAVQGTSLPGLVQLDIEQTPPHVEVFLAFHRDVRKVPRIRAVAKEIESEARRQIR
jgi:hypothetical protein